MNQLSFKAIMVRFFSLIFLGDILDFYLKRMKQFVLFGKQTLPLELASLERKFFLLLGNSILINLIIEQINLMGLILELLQLVISDFTHQILNIYAVLNIVVEHLSLEIN